MRGQNFGTRSMSINDPQWGRNAGSGKSGADDNHRDEERRDEDADRSREERAGGADNRNEERHNDERRDDARRDDGRRGGQENDLDQLWNDFNRMLGSIMGGGNQQRRRPGEAWQQDRDERDDRDARDDRAGNAGSDRDEAPYRARQTRSSGSGFGGNGGLGGMMRSRRGGSPRHFPVKGLAALVGVAILAWAASGIYIVPEGQVGVVTTFGRYTKDSAAGINWRMPWPVQDVEIVDVSSVRKAEIGIRGTTTRLQEALMLTDDENIVDVQFNIQYRIRPHQAKDYLFRSRDPDQSVIGAAESAMREVVGRKTMDSVLFESKQEIASNVQTIMQQMLDRYQTGIEVMSVAIQNAQPPQPVQAAFNDAVKAGQDRERQINEGQAYANAVVPVARGTAARLLQEAEGYKSRVIETATGDAARFSMVLSQYEKAPQVTRERIYIDAMRDIYASTRKVLVDSRAGSNLLYLPLDKLINQSAVPAKDAGQAAGAATSSVVTGGSAASSVRTPVDDIVPATTSAADFDPRAAFRMRGE